MFIKSVSLTKDHWSYKLLYWTFPSLPKFYNFCPYFWLTILSIIVAPFKLLGIGISWIISTLLINPINNFMERREKKSIEYWNKKAKELKKRLTKDELKVLLALKYYDYITERSIDKCVYKETMRNFKILDRSQYGRELLRKMYIKSEYNKDISPSFREFLEMNRRTVKESIPSSPVKERPWYPTAIKYTKHSLWVLIIPCIYLLYKLFYWLFFFLGWVWYWIEYGAINMPWIDVLIGVLLVLGVVAVGFLVGIGTRYLFEMDEFWNKYCRFCQRVYNTFLWPFRMTGSIFSFFWRAIILFKKDNCPAIIWEDEKE